MPWCHECQSEMEVVARCAGDNCTAGICPLCFEGDGLCGECRAESAAHIDCPPLAAELIAILLSGATIGGERMPRCAATGEPADECEHVEVDDARVD